MIHPSKSIFKYLAKLLKLSEIECYILYLDNGENFRLDFNSFAENLHSDSELTESFYIYRLSDNGFFDVNIFLPSIRWKENDVFVLFLTREPRTR